MDRSQSTRLARFVWNAIVLLADAQSTARKKKTVNRGKRSKRKMPFAFDMQNKFVCYSNWRQT